MRIALFVNDSYFSYLLAKPLIDKYHKEISLLILSTRVQGSLSQIIQIYKKSSIEYFCYRSTVQVFSIINRLLRRKTVESLAEKYNVNFIKLSSVNRNICEISRFKPFDIGFAFNFDQIIGKEVLDLFKIGVINVHASKLPDDRGISPVLWAFARGDVEIWSSIYKMDSGIDTGPIIEQFKIPVDADSTAFSLYKKVCVESGNRLIDVVEKLKKQAVVFKPQVISSEENYWSWPDSHHTQMLKQNNRRLIRLADVLTILE